MRTPDEFESAAQEHDIARWPLHNCSFCQYEVAYLFDGPDVAIDTGCNCVPGPPTIRSTTWANVANQYNIQDNDRVIAKYDEFWHFTEAARG